jgi:hypothetical protein
VKVEPRIVEDLDENRLTGYAALPTNLNPYLEQFGNPVLAAAAIRPLAGTYDVVFDSAERLRCRRLRVPLLGRRHAAAVPQADAGPRSPQRPARRACHGPRLRHRPDDDQGHGRRKALHDEPSWEARSGSVRPASSPGSTGCGSRSSDYQESRNMENVPPILPNTRVLSAAIVLR